MARPERRKRKEGKDIGYRKGKEQWRRKQN
jgi:hypothetical protein